LYRCGSLLFFFSSRRRHTRSKRDWSSDVCSSDLDALHGVHQGLSQEVCDRFHELVGRCVALMDPMNIEAYPDVKRTTAQREAMVHGYREEPWRWDAVVVDDVDEDRGLVKLVYHFTGEQPREEIFVAGNAIAPRHSKTRDFVYLRRPLVHERILWVSLRGTLSI